MTLPLVQKLYAELDPHKKGYVTFNDWQNALQAFNYSDQTIIELKNSMQCAFADCESAFQFFLSFKSNSDLKKKTINRVDFEKAINSLSSNRFSKTEIENFWKVMSDNGKYLTLDKYIFRSNFDNI